MIKSVTMNGIFRSNFVVGRSKRSFTPLLPQNYIETIDCEYFTLNFLMIGGTKYIVLW